MSDSESFKRNSVDYGWVFSHGALALGHTDNVAGRSTHHQPVAPQEDAAETLTSTAASTLPQAELVDLFNNNKNIVDFNFVTVGQYKPGSQYNALGGDDIVHLPNDAAKAQISGYDPNKTFNGGNGNDQVFGGTLNDSLQGGSGIDQLFGGDGNDKLNGGIGNDFLDGGNGDDKLFGDRDDDFILGNAGSDELSGDMGSDWLDGGAGIDHLKGGDGNDTLDGGLDGGTAIDTLEGGKGDDTYIAWDTSDVLIEQSNEGVDLVKASVNYTLGDNIENLMLMSASNLNGIGNNLDNFITGNSGSNQIDGGVGDDTLIGGAGIDFASYETSQKGVFARLDDTSQNTGDAQGDSYQTIEGLKGSAFNDILIGGNGDDIISGEDGNDLMLGGIGKDFFIGGAGKDGFGFVPGQGSATLDKADIVQDFQDRIDLLAVGNDLDLSDIHIFNVAGDAVLFSMETNQFICVVKNCAGKITEADFGMV